MLKWIGRAACGLAVAVLVVLRPGDGRAAAPLTLEEVLDSVDRSHPKLEEAQRKVQSAEGKALAARGGFDPRLTIRSKWMPVGYYGNGQVDALVRQASPLWGASFYAGYRVGFGSYPIYKGDLQTLSGGEVRAGLEVPLWRNGPIDSRRAKIQQTRIRRQGARLTLDATQLELERDAARAYWSCVEAGLSLRIARELLAIAQRRDTALREQVGAGALEPIKLVDNRRLILDRQAKVVAAQRKFQEASLKLSLYLRDLDQNPVRIGEDRVPPKFPEPGSIDIGALDDEVEQALRRRPDLEALLTEQQAAGVAVRLARNQRAPAVNLQTFVARDMGDGPAELRPTEWGAGVVLELPIPLREARGEYRAAQADAAAIEARLRGLRDGIGAQVRAAHVALVAALQGVELARAHVEVANELAQAEQIRLREGAGDLVIVNLRELAAADAANDEVEALAEYHRARADFLVSTGRSPTP